MAVLIIADSLVASLPPPDQGGLRLLSAKAPISFYGTNKINLRALHRCTASARRNGRRALISAARFADQTVIEASAAMAGKPAIIWADGCADARITASICRRRSAGMPAT